MSARRVVRIAATATALLALGATPTALAADAWLGCFARTYDAAHLQKNPAQKIRVLAIELKAAQEPEAAYAAVITAATTTGKLRFRQDADCLRTQATLECWVSPYRGYVVLSRTADGVRIENPLGVRLDAADESDKSLEIEADADHRVFVLDKGKPELCK